MFPYPEIIRFVSSNSQIKNDKKGLALDVGTGSGVHIALLENYGFNTIAIDKSQAAINFAKTHFASTKSSLICDDLQNLHQNIEDKRFNLVIDRLSSTHSSKKIVANIYQDPSLILKRGGKFLWSGFDDSNSHKKYAKIKHQDYYQDFSEGKFKDLYQACFFSEQEVIGVFRNYKITRFERISSYDIINNTEDSHWLVEGVYIE